MARGTRAISFAGLVFAPLLHSRPVTALGRAPMEAAALVCD